MKNVEPRRFGVMIDCLFMLLNARDIKPSDVSDWQNDSSVRQAKRDVYIVSNPEMTNDWEFLTELTESEYGMISDHLDGLTED